ncbi:MAG: hypothetical protein U0800_26145 [Isosphaeraceae bacterium]
MSIVSKMRAQLTEAMKARDTVRVGFLRYWIAQFTRGDGTEVADDEAIKKLRGVAKEAKAGPTSFKPDRNRADRRLGPRQPGPGPISTTRIDRRRSERTHSKPGAAMGMAMKQLAGKPVCADDVKAVVDEMRA